VNEVVKDETCDVKNLCDHKKQMGWMELEDMKCEHNVK